MTCSESHFSSSSAAQHSPHIPSFSFLVSLDSLSIHQSISLYLCLLVPLLYPPPRSLSLSLDRRCCCSSSAAGGDELYLDGRLLKCLSSSLLSSPPSTAAAAAATLLEDPDPPALSSWCPLEGGAGADLWFEVAGTSDVFLFLEEEEDDSFSGKLMRENTLPLCFLSAAAAAAAAAELGGAGGSAGDSDRRW